MFNTTRHNCRHVCIPVLIVNPMIVALTERPAAFIATNEMMYILSSCRSVMLNLVEFPTGALLPGFSSVSLCQVTSQLVTTDPLRTLQEREMELEVTSEESTLRSPSTGAGGKCIHSITK